MSQHRLCHDGRPPSVAVGNREETATRANDRRPERNLLLADIQGAAFHADHACLVNRPVCLYWFQLLHRGQVWRVVLHRTVQELHRACICHDDEWIYSDRILLHAQRQECYFLLCIDPVVPGVVLLDILD